jgi:HK97 family phage major capsid protein
MRHERTRQILLSATALSTGGLRTVFAEGPSGTEVKAALDGLNKVFAEFKAANDERLKGVEKKFEDVVTNEKVEKINASVTTLQTAFDDMSAKLARAQLGSGAGTALTPEQDEHKKAFNSWFRNGENEATLKAAQVKAAATTSNDPSAGFVVPAELETTIDRVLGTVSQMRTLATVRKMGAASYKKPFNVGGAQGGWVGETEARPETGTPQLVELEFPAMTLYANPFATQDLLDDAVIDIAAWLSDEVNLTFAEQEGAAFVSGNGAKRPRGLLSYPTVADADYAWGKLGYQVTGVNGAFAADAPGDKLLDLIYALKAGYRLNATWLMNRTTVAAVRKMKDGNDNYLWQPSAQAGQPATLMNFPVVDDDNMPAMATDALSVAFGDFKRGYLIVDRMGVRVVRDAFSAKPYVQFYTTKRVGGGVQNFEAIKLLKFGTS